jgi:uncharacterized membrane protein
MFNQLVHSTTGLVHLVSSVAAVFLGTAVLLGTKGTLTHKRVGYAYVVAMLILNLTAFMIYRLFGRFGPFHVAAVVSTISLIGGMVPVLVRHRIAQWFQWHMRFMYYSVIGLYAALASEIIVRVPGIRFWWSVAGATFLIVFLGVYLFERHHAKWLRQFGQG